MKPEHLKRWRADMGMTQAEAAKLLNAGVEAYRKWEQGRTPVPGPIARLCSLLERQG